LFANLTQQTTIGKVKKLQRDFGDVDDDVEEEELSPVVPFSPHQSMDFSRPNTTDR